MRLTEEQLDWLYQRAPDCAVSPRDGRPAMCKRDALRGVFWVLDSGAKRKYVPQRFASKSAVHRRFTTWARAGVFGTIMCDSGRLVEDRGQYGLYECFIDATFSKIKGDGVGLTKAGKGVKIMVLVDALGLPVAVDTASATPHESKLVQGLFDFILTADTRERLIGNKTYDGDKLNNQLASHGIHMLAPHRSSRLPENVTHDGRELRRYKRRWTVERAIAWLQNYRRLCIRWERSSKLFQGFLHLTCSLMLIRQVLG